MQFMVWLQEKLCWHFNEICHSLLDKIPLYLKITQSCLCLSFVSNFPETFNVQFFLSDRAVYLLMWNIRLGHEHAGLDFWLSSISVHAPKAPIFVVGTHVDQVVLLPKNYVLFVYISMCECIMSSVSWESDYSQTTSEYDPVRGICVHIREVSRGERWRKKRFSIQLLGFFWLFWALNFKRKNTFVIFIVYL